MLQTQSVYPTTLELLKELMAFRPLNDFNLVGGTALALQLGHRISVDLDFFGDAEFDKDEMLFQLREHFGHHRVSLVLKKGFALIVQIDGIKVDIIRYPYDLLQPILIENTIRLLSIKDIAAMKHSAIAQRGSKKDFFDMYELLSNFTIQETMSLFQAKFSNDTIGHIIRSLDYFEDAEIQEDPIMLKDYTWEQVKDRMRQAVHDYMSSI